MRKKIMESKDVLVYKLLLNAFGEYTDSYPLAGIGRLFDALIEQGKKSVPSDKRAAEILEYLLTEKPCTTAVQNILNMRFTDLPVKLKPITKNGKKHEMAFWCIDGKLFDQVRYLINFDGLPGTGNWSDENCKKVALIN